MLGTLAYLLLNPLKVTTPKITPTFPDILGTITYNLSSQSNILGQAKDLVEGNSQKVADSAKDTAYLEAQSALDRVFGKESSKDTAQAVFVSVEDAGNNQGHNVYNIDLSKTTNLKLNLQKNTDYYLKFQNTPADYCLYINESKHPIKDQTVKLIFTSSGTYSLKANTCNLDDKVLGELTVQ